MPVSTTIAARAQSVQLTPSEMTRYSRHLLLGEVGLEGQKRLKAARVLIVGAGGLGAPVGMYLAAAGVGTIGIVDFDIIDTTNLQRQILYADDQVGTLKLDAAVQRLQGIAPTITIVPHAARLTVDNAARLIADYDIVVDGTDNFATRYLINDACVLAGKPNVYGSILRFDGQASVFYAPHGPCYRCLFPAPPPAGQVPSCAEGGVLGVLPGQIGTIQANEALKLILGIGTSLLGRLLTLDALDMRIEEFKLHRDPDCPVCGSMPQISSVADSAAHDAIACAVPIGTAPIDEVDPVTLKAWLADGQPLVLVDVRSAGEATVCRIEGSRLIPLPELSTYMAELAQAPRVVLHCKSGARSAQAAKLLLSQTQGRVFNLRGGILAWIDQCDPSLARY